MRPLGPARIVGVARIKHVLHLLFQCVPIIVFASHKNTINHTNVHKELPGFVDTKVSKFYPIMKPPFCSIGVGGNDGRQHDKYIFNIIYLFFFRWFYQSILDLDITEIGLFIFVIMEYTIKSRQLNPTTVTFVVNVELVDGGEVNNQWCIRFLVPITEASHVSFHNFQNRLIRKILITESVLSSLEAFELIKFKNNISQIEFQQNQTSLVILKKITCFQKESQSWNMMIFFNAGSNNEPHLHVFRFKQDEEEFVSN